VAPEKLIATGSVDEPLAAAGTAEVVEVTTNEEAAAPCAEASERPAGEPHAPRATAARVAAKVRPGRKNLLP
jgi:hypothetical protein